MPQRVDVRLGGATVRVGLPGAPTHAPGQSHHPVGHAETARERDDQGRLKLNPLADWSWADVWHYVAVNEVPYNALHDRGYPSIGCDPCTRATAE